MTFLLSLVAEYLHLHKGIHVVPGKFILLCSESPMAEEYLNGAFMPVWTLVKATFDAAYHERNKPDHLLFHSDQGIQYTAYPFRHHLKRLNVRQSFSHSGSPLDNSVCESFFRTLKKEALYHHLYNNPDELQEVMEEYIRFL